MLSQTELEIARELSRGNTSNEAIATALRLSVLTVRNRVTSAMMKTGIRNRAQLALWGLDRG